MKSKLAIFDMDGTLFDTRPVNYLSYKKAIESIGKEFTMAPEQFNSECYGKSYRNFLPFFHLSEEEIEEVHERKLKLYPKMLKEGTRKNSTLFDVLQAISKQYYIALVTTASRKNVIELLEYYACEECFDLILTSEDVIRKKPNAEGYLKAMNYFKVKPEDAMIFEDTEECVKSAMTTGATVYKVELF